MLPRTCNLSPTAACIRPPPHPRPVRPVHLRTGSRCGHGQDKYPSRWLPAFRRHVRMAYSGARLGCGRGVWTWPRSDSHVGRWLRPGGGVGELGQVAGPALVVRGDGRMRQSGVDEVDPGSVLVCGEGDTDGAAARGYLGVVLESPGEDHSVRWLDFDVLAQDGGGVVHDAAVD